MAFISALRKASGVRHVLDILHAFSQVQCSCSIGFVNVLCVLFVLSNADADLYQSTMDGQSSKVSEMIT